MALPIIVYVAVAGVVILILYFFAQSQGINIGLLKKYIAGKETNEMRADVRSIPENRKVRIVSKKYNYNDIVDSIIIVGRDEKYGFNKIRFKTGERISDFSVLDSPYSIHPQGGPVEVMTSDKRPIWEIIDDDPFKRLFEEKQMLDLQVKTLLQELAELKTGTKKIMRETAELTRENKRAMFGLTGNQQPSSPFGAPFRPWSPYNRFGGGQQEGESEESV